MALSFSVLSIQQSGATPVGFVPLTLNVGGTPTLVNVQAGVLLDPLSGAPSVIDANGLHVFPVLGTPVSSGVISNTNVGAGTSATLTSPAPVTSGKTGTLQHAIFASTQPVLWTLQTVNNAGTPTNVSSFITDTNRTYDFKPGSPGEVSTVQSSGASCVFQATALSLSTNQAVAASVYSAFFWAEN